MSHPMRHHLLCLALLLSVALPVTARAQTRARTAPAKPATRATASRAPAAKPAEPTLYLSWNAPYGSPRARAATDAPCGDTTAVDTLYLTFDPGRDAGFVGASAVLFFHPGAGQELGAIWKGAAPSPVRVIFTSDPERGFVTPWSSQAAGGPQYDVFGSSGRLRFIYAMAAGSGAGVRAGQRTGLARVLIPRAPAGADGCGAPMCIEWASASLAWSPEAQAEAKGGERWVSMNSPEGAACASRRGTPAVPAWKPRPAR